LNRIHDSSRLKKRFSTALAELFFAPTVFLGLRFLVVIEQGKDYSNTVNPNREEEENIVYVRDSCCFSFPRIFHRSNFPGIGYALHSISPTATLISQGLFARKEAQCNFAN
jgi:hypothetical protein